MGLNPLVSSAKPARFIGDTEMKSNRNTPRSLPFTPEPDRLIEDDYPYPINNDIGFFNYHPIIGDAEMKSNRNTPRSLPFTPSGSSAEPDRFIEDDHPYPINDIGFMYVRLNMNETEKAKRFFNYYPIIGDTEMKSNPNTPPSLPFTPSGSSAEVARFMVDDYPYINIDGESINGMAAIKRIRELGVVMSCLESELGRVHPILLSEDMKTSPLFYSPNIGDTENFIAVQQQINQMEKYIHTLFGDVIKLRKFLEYPKENAGVDDGMKELQEAFEMYDFDKVRLISVSPRLGNRCAEDDRAKTIKWADSDIDGCVNRDEFENITLKSSLEDKVTSRVPYWVLYGTFWFLLMLLMSANTVLKLNMRVLRQTQHWIEKVADSVDNDGV